MEALHTINGSLPPSHNQSNPGFIHLYNEELGLLNTQLVQFNFQFSVPSHILKADKCRGQILLEFKYLTNSDKFNGTWNTTLAKAIDYRCTVTNKNTALTTVRLSVPNYSVAYDEINNNLVVCKRRLVKESAQLPSCYLQSTNNVTWISIPDIAATVGIDTQKKHIYGIDLKGKSYYRSMQSYIEFSQVGDSEWVNIRDRSDVRKAKEVNSVETLPSQPTAAWNLPANGNAVIAITRTGVQRRQDGTWKRVFQF